VRNDVGIQGDFAQGGRDPLPEIERQGFPETQVTADAENLGSVTRRARIGKSLEVYSKPVTGVELRLLVTKRLDCDPLDIRYTGFRRNLWIAYLV